MSTPDFKYPSKLETILFNAGLVQQVPLSEIYDIKAGTSIQRAWQDPDFCNAVPDVRDPEQWTDKLHASIRGEFFVYVLRDCTNILDVGCGEGWPSLYLARSFPKVTGIDLSPEHINLAINSARLMGLKNVEFKVARIEELPFTDERFDGVCFGGNVFSYDCDPAKMLRELRRVLKTGGIFAFEQWPGDPQRPPYERIVWFIDGGPPILHYQAGYGLIDRSYFIFIKPASPEGKRLAELADHVTEELSDTQRIACEKIKDKIEDGALDIVEKAIYSGEDRALAKDEFPRLLNHAGFEDIKSWALPKSKVFSEALKDAGILNRLKQEDLIPCLRALIMSAPHFPNWEHQWVSCVKK